MTDAGVRFIRKNGRVIPIRAAAAAVHGIRAARAAKLAGTGAALIARHGLTKSQSNPIKVDPKFSAAGLGLSVASGALEAATFAGGARGIALGQVGSHILDAAGVAANVASVRAAHASTADKAKQAAKQELRNFIVGNAVMGAGLVGIKRNRAVLAKYGTKALSFAKKIIRGAT